MQDAGKLLLGVAVVLAVAGVAMMLFGRSNLPGNIIFRTGGVTVYIPIAAGVILSIVLTVVANILFRQR
ncbi:MAG TPA: DUF2905 domain-containing protein [Candidatus Dormibacteraeota bacterium]|jgi:hypothetical protein